ncbi:MAG TPA: hypothetical protein DDY91_23435 [Planctomycetaceae bacterium]|jgi:uncharacterized protein YqjF (DUF2071 family)|nr:hypothetical protein [Planctomycetaceae bacterium]
MSPASPEIDRIAPTRRPAGPAVGYHTWRDLTFLHWKFPPELIAPLIPAGLTLDTFEGEAWVGLVPFFMANVRPSWFWAVPGLSHFCETNVRTYVHFRGQDPGVWFLSLDASNSIAVLAARLGWHLPYFRSEMSLTVDGSWRRYRSIRRWPGPRGVGCQVSARFGPLLGSDEPHRAKPPGEAIPGSFEHFLVERYLLFAQGRDGSLHRGQVHHRPYPVSTVTELEYDDSLLPSHGLTVSRPPDHIAASTGVDVEIFPLRRISD